MRRYYLRPLPGKAAVAGMRGKQIFLRSLYPPLAQVVSEGKLTALLRIVREPLFSTELYPAAGPANNRIDFFNNRVNQTTANGLILTDEDTNMTANSQIGEPEVEIPCPVRTVKSYRKAS